MRRTIALLVVLVLLASFALLNWSAFSAPTAVSLGVTTVQAPLGLIMLALLALLSVLFAAWALSLQASVLLEARRHAKDLQAQRSLADSAEASRFTELRNHMDAELARLARASDEARAGVLARIEALAVEIRTAQEQSANSVAAYFGELEDRLNRLPSLPPDVPPIL
jgi:uncharacterized integral membrane protein